MDRKSFVSDRITASVQPRWWLLAAAIFAAHTIDAAVIDLPPPIAPTDEAFIESESMFGSPSDSEMSGSEPFIRASKAAAAENWEGVIAALAEEDASIGPVRVLRVLAFTRLGRLDEAERLLRALLEETPGLTVIAFELSTVLTWQARYDEAEQVLQKTGADLESDPFLLAGLARVQTGRGETQAAIRLYEQAIALRPNTDDDARYVDIELARLLSGSGAYTQVTRLLEPYANAAPATPQQRTVLLLLADAQLVLGNAAAAEKIAGLLRGAGASLEADGIDARIAALRGHAGEASATSAAGPQAHRQVYLLKRQSGDVDGAADALMAAFEASNRESEAARVMHDLVNYLVETNRADRAVEVMQAGMQRWPDSDEIGFLLAGTLYAVGRYDEGLETTRALLRRRDDFAAAHGLQAKLLWALGRHQQAVSAMQVALDRDPKLVQHWVDLAYMQHQLGGHKAMNRVIDTALTENAAHPALLVERARLHGAEGQSAAANRIYREVIEQNPDYIPAYLYLAVNLAESGQDPAEALRLVVHANRLGPRDPVVRGTFGWVLSYNDDYEYGVFYLRQAVAALPARGLFRLRLADALIRAGTPQTALAELKKAKESGLTDADLKKADALIASLQ